MGVGYNPKIVTDGLVLTLDAANPKSYPGTGTAWSDLSGNGNNGTLVNGVGYSSDNLGSLVFDGVNDNVNCGNGSILNVGNNITVNSWFYVATNSTYQPVVAKVDSGGTLGWEMANSAGVFRATLRPTATLINLTSTALTVGNWYMGTMTFDNTTLKLYLNGVQVGSTTSGGPVTLNSTHPLQVGTRGAGNLYIGNIANALMYNRALTAVEVQQNFNATRSRYDI